MKHIYKEKKLGENETRRYMRQMVSAVDHLHKAGIIHRYIYIPLTHINHTLGNTTASENIVNCE